MKAVVSKLGEGPDGLTIEERPSLSAGPAQVVVQVRASALNRADLMQTLGLYPAPAGVVADVPGLEYAGEIAAVGAQVTRWKVGDRVMGLVAGGGWAEQLLAHEREVIAMPAGFDFKQAAAIPEAFITAWDALVVQGGMQSGQHVLVHAIASGVGTAALQLCALTGAHVVGTGRSQPKLERVKALGLTHALQTPKPSFASQVRALTNGGANLALDLVGGDYVPETIDAMALNGTIVLVGLVGGASADVPLRTVLGKRLKIIGTTLRARPLEEKIAAARAFEARLVPAFATGVLKPVIDATIDMKDVKAGLLRMASNDTVGKIVLTW